MPLALAGDVLLHKIVGLHVLSDLPLLDIVPEHLDDAVEVDTGPRAAADDVAPGASVLEDVCLARPLLADGPLDNLGLLSCGQ